MKNSSESIAKLSEALNKAQAILEGAKKDNSNPYFKSKYADLSSVWSACRKPLTDNGLAVIQGTEVVEGNTYLCTILTHISGEWVKSYTPILLGVKQDMQALGSAITYARRYSLSSIVGVCTEDDDGEASMSRSYSKPSDSSVISISQCDLVKKQINLMPHLEDKILDSLGIDRIEQMLAKDFTRIMKGLEMHKQKEAV